MNKKMIFLLFGLMTLSILSVYAYQKYAQYIPTTDTISLAAAFRREVIAEGVETIEHGKMLLQLGCELRRAVATRMGSAASRSESRQVVRHNGVFKRSPGKYSFFPGSPG